MIINFILLLVFFASVFLLWYRVSQKIPELIAIPDQVITERLREDSAKIRLLVIHLRTLYQEKKIQRSLWNLWGKILYRIHIWVLRLDNGIAGSLKKIRAHGVDINENGNGAVQPEPQQENPEPIVKDHRIQEIRVKK